MTLASGHDRIRDTFAFVLFTLSLLTVAMLTASAAGIPLSPAVARAAAAACLAGGWGMMRLQRRLDGSGVPVGRSASHEPRSILLGAVPLIVAALYLGLWFAALVAPDRSWDGNIYHLPTLHNWLHAGRITWIDPRMPFADLMNGYPKEAELMSMVAVGVSGSSRFSHCGNLIFLPLGFLAVARLAGLAGVGRRGALVCGALFVLAPVNIAQSVTAYIDTAYACCVAAFLASVGLAIERLRRTASVPWPCLPLLGCSFGLSLGIRPTALFLLPGALVAMGMLRPRSKSTRPGRAEFFVRAALLVGAASLCGLVVGGFWYARNLWREDNPFYPVRISFLGKTLFAGRPMEEIGILGHEPPVMASWSRPRQILYAWGEGFEEWPASIRNVDSPTGGLGLVWLLGCVPAILVLGWRTARDPAARQELTPLLACAAVAVLPFLATPENWWARYTVWILAVGLPCFARVVRDALASGRGTKLVKSWATVCILIALLEGALGAADVFSRSYPGPRPFRPGEALHAASWRWPSNYLYPNTRGSLLDQILEGNDTVAFGPTLTEGACRVRGGMVGQLAQPAGARSILPIPLAAGEVEMEQLIRGGAKYLIWDTGAIAPHCSPSEAVLKLGSSWSQADGFWISPMRTQEASR
ncbi:MAG TPA: hypothetical protein VFW45_16315 [Candidatus Polarisedimenticolia bacterium]|nr:hypothetical protein [Candidatus Polarisedimenticolia bacterium]